MHEPIDKSNGNYVAHYLDSICDLLPDVLESTVRNKLWNKNQNTSDIEEVLNNLSDGGFIIITKSLFETMWSISNIAVYVELSHRRSTSKLTLKDLIAKWDLVCFDR